METWASSVKGGKILGWACPNPVCDQREMLIVLPATHCRLCGSAMMPASVVALGFAWEQHPGCGTCAWMDQRTQDCYNTPDHKHVSPGHKACGQYHG